MSVKKDKSILKKVLKKGKGWSQPNDGCMLEGKCWNEWWKYDVYGGDIHISNFTLHRWCVPVQLWTMKFEMWSLKYEVWNVKFEVWSLKCEVWNVIMQNLNKIYHTDLELYTLLCVQTYILKRLFKRNIESLKSHPCHLIITCFENVCLDANNILVINHAC